MGLVVHHLVFFRKNPQSRWEKSFRKTHGWMGKTFVGSCIVRKTHGWLGKTYVWQLIFRKTHDWLGKTYFVVFDGLLTARCVRKHRVGCILELSR